MNVEMYRDALQRLIDVLETRRKITIELSKNQQSHPDFSSPVGSPTRVDRSHREFIEAIEKMLGDWNPACGQEELLGYSKEELYKKFFYAVSSGITTIESQMTHYFTSANNIGSFADSRPAISISDRHIEKVNSTKQAAMRIRQHADAARALAELLGQLLEIRAIMLES